MRVAWCLVALALLGCRSASSVHRNYAREANHAISEYQRQVDSVNAEADAFNAALREKAHRTMQASRDEAEERLDAKAAELTQRLAEADAQHNKDREQVVVNIDALRELLKSKKKSERLYAAEWLPRAEAFLANEPPRERDDYIRGLQEELQLFRNDLNDQIAAEDHRTTSTYEAEYSENESTRELRIARLRNDAEAKLQAAAVRRQSELVAAEENRQIWAAAFAGAAQGMQHAANRHLNRPRVPATVKVSSGCANDFQCGIGSKCVKSVGSFEGRCAEVVNEFGVGQFRLPDPNSVYFKPFGAGECQFDVNCPTTFYCDPSAKVCMRR